MTQGAGWLLGGARICWFLVGGLLSHTWNQPLWIIFYLVEARRFASSVELVLEGGMTSISTSVPSLPKINDWVGLADFPVRVWLGWNFWKHFTEVTDAISAVWYSGWMVSAALAAVTSGF